jgi:amidase
LKIQLNQYYEALLENPSGVRSLAELIAFDNANPTLEEPAGFKDQSMYSIISLQQVTYR